MSNYNKDLNPILQLLVEKPEVYYRFRESLKNYVETDLKIESILAEKKKAVSKMNPTENPDNPGNSEANKIKKKLARNESKYILEILQDSRRRTHLDESSRSILKNEEDAFKDSRILRTNWKPSLITPNILVLDACVAPDAPNHLYPDDPYKPTRLEKTFNLDNMLEQNLLPKVYEILGFNKKYCFDSGSSSFSRYAFRMNTKDSIQSLEFVSNALESEILSLKETFSKTKSIMYLEKMYQFRYGILGISLVRSFLELAYLNYKPVYMRFRHNILD